MHKLKWCMALPLCLVFSFLQAQGPPITGGKPIMLGTKTWLVKTLTEIRKNETARFLKAPVIVHYLPSSKILVGIHTPLVSDEKNTYLGDVELIAKYQFYRKDQMGKTFRIVAKTVQTLPTGKPILAGISTGDYQSYQGIVAGYETIKYGISNELGYNLYPSNDLGEWRYKLGFGLPLLKPTYPVKQINLYFEYQNSWFPKLDEYFLLYAQGIQYAKGRWTVEAAVQFPLIQYQVSEMGKRDYSVFLGTRYVF